MIQFIGNKNECVHLHGEVYKKIGIVKYIILTESSLLCEKVDEKE